MLEAHARAIVADVNKRRADSEGRDVKRAKSEMGESIEF